LLEAGKFPKILGLAPFGAVVSSGRLEERLDAGGLNVILQENKSDCTS